jgi:hypothetical protein
MSTLNVANITDGTDTVETGYVVNGSAKAWVNLEQIGTQSIQDSFNTSSIIDTDTGRTTPTWISAMSNSTYAASFAAWDTAYYLTVSCGSVKTTTGYMYACARSGTTTKEDCDEVHLLAHGDLA